MAYSTPGRRRSLREKRSHAGAADDARLEMPEGHSATTRTKGRVDEEIYSCSPRTKFLGVKASDHVVAKRHTRPRLPRPPRTPRPRRGGQARGCVAAAVMYRERVNFAGGSFEDKITTIRRACGRSSERKTSLRDHVVVCTHHTSWPTVQHVSTADESKSDGHGEV
jgi:hypothetical protein